MTRHRGSRSGGGVDLLSTFSYAQVPLCRTAVILENSNHVLFRMMIQMTDLLHSSKHSATEDVQDDVATKNANSLLEVKAFKMTQVYYFLGKLNKQL